MTEEWQEEMKSCQLCPHACLVDRLHGELGYCRAGSQVRLALVSLHKGEEPCVSGERGAGTVFFSHCNLRCVFCQNHEISHAGRGRDITIAQLAEVFLAQQQRGAATLDLVTPVHYAPQIRAALRLAKERGLRLPIVYNTNAYEKVRTVQYMAGCVDVFLPDLKYQTPESGQRYSGASDYFAAASQAIEEMVRLKGEPMLDAEGILRRGVLVRHLILPGHRHESMAVLDYLWQHFGNGIVLSLMNQYTPLYQASSYPELARRLTTFEYESVLDYAYGLGFTSAYIQQGSAAGVDFVPSFDGSGIIGES